MSDKIKAVCNRIINLDPKEFKLNMSSFCNQNYISKEVLGGNTCGTTFCLVGWLAQQDGYPEQYRTGTDDSGSKFSFAYLAYSADFLGIDDVTKSPLWQFLFIDFWPDKLNQAKKRAQYLLDNDCNYPPDVDTWVEQFKYPVRYVCELDSSLTGM